MHFPQTDDGRYAGHYPADGREASAHVEQLRVGAAQYLVFPSTAFWWLDHYSELREHLDNRYTRIWSDANCLIFRLSESEPSHARAPKAARCPEPG